jgi:hypothetical protein
MCTVNIALRLGHDLADHVAHVGTIEVQPTDFYGTGRLTNRPVTLALLAQQWQFEESISADHPTG